MKDNGRNLWLLRVQQKIRLNQRASHTFGAGFQLQSKKLLFRGTIDNTKIRKNICDRLYYFIVFNIGIKNKVITNYG